MKIETVDCDLFHVPLSTPLTDATHGRMDDFGLITIRVRDSDGGEGLGLTYTVGQTGGASIVTLLRRDIAPHLIGRDPRHIEKIWQMLWQRLHYVGRGGLASFAISAVDIALWDLKARRAGEPLWRLLGGHTNQTPAYAGGIDLHLGPAELQEQTGTNLERGFRAIKMKVGRDRLAEDVERVAAVRQVLGPDLPLMVDANMRWTVARAIQAARAFAVHNVYWLEEPTIPEDFDGHRRIQQEGGLPVASGENLRTVFEFHKIIDSGGVSFPEPDVSNIGGVTAWLKVARYAELHNLPVTSHGVHELHVHLLAAVPNSSFLEAHGFGLEAYLETSPSLDGGLMKAPDSPGHGMVFLWDKLAQHRVEG